MLLSIIEAPTLWTADDTLRWLVTGAYLGLMALIGVYGLHRYWLVYLFGRHHRTRPRPGVRYAEMPRVTVQLPVFNEGTVVQRIIDAACKLDFPRDRLQVQVVDDSTDDSIELAKQRVAYWEQQGVDIQHLHRTDRTGFKAGALQAATQSATGDLIAIFDADFVPPRSFLKRTIHYFTDPKLGMVQTRWTHLNRNDSWLTRSQAIFLDGHFVIEHTARNRNGAWINFNGTAGLWRREAIESAGGWQHDTLTEDVDLSYRAQLAGWDFLFLPWVQCPAELPPEINAFKSQQHRWTKGSIQTALKLLPTLMRANVSKKIKLEAFFHLTSPMVYLFVTLLAVMFYPVISLNVSAGDNNVWLSLLFGLGLFSLGTISATVFYIASQRAQKRGVMTTILQVPYLMAIGIGIALNNAIACLEALLGYDTPFVRTPKYSMAGVTRIIPIPDLKRPICLLELAMGCYMLLCIGLSLNTGHRAVSIPFLCLFAAGYFYVGGSSLWIYLRGYLETRRPLPQVA